MLEALRHGQIADHGAGIRSPAQLPTKGYDRKTDSPLGGCLGLAHFLNLAPGCQLDARLEGDTGGHTVNPDAANVKMAQLQVALAESFHGCVSACMGSTPRNGRSCKPS